MCIRREGPDYTVSTVNVCVYVCVSRYCKCVCLNIEYVRVCECVSVCLVIFDVEDTSLSDLTIFSYLILPD